MLHASVYFPTLSNALKTIAGYLGFHWSDTDASGIESILWRLRWEQTRDDIWKDRLLRYNLDDCLALRVVTDFVASLHPDHAPDETTVPPQHPTVVNTRELQGNAGRSHRFGKIQFVFAELDFVNKCAYFDYQREKVYVRTSKGIRCGKRQKQRKREIGRPNTRIELAADSCLTCGSTKLSLDRAVRRTVVDLKFFRSGVKRWITLYESHKHVCRRCGAMFIPADFPTSREKYGHGLKCWYSYQNIVGGQNFMKITRGVKEIFGLTIPSSYDRFRRSLVAYYQPTIEALRQDILSGSLLHIDETEVIMRGKAEKKCVWVITNMHAVHYFYKESRSGVFLEEMLQGFSGVIVSDFFTGPARIR